MVSEDDPGRFKLNRKPEQDFNGVAVVLLGPSYDLREAWTAPWRVIDELGHISSLPARGKWQTAPGVKRLDVPGRSTVGIDAAPDD